MNDDKVTYFFRYKVRNTGGDEGVGVLRCLPLQSEDDVGRELTDYFQAKRIDPDSVFLLTLNRL